MTYALEPGGPKRLEVSWKAMWKDFTVKVDDRVVGVVSDPKQLREGKQFKLKDGSTLSVRLRNTLSGVDLEILRDGQPLPGTSADPATRHKAAYGVIFFVAVLNTFLGMSAVLFQIPFLLTLGVGFSSAIFGLVFLLLGFLVKRKSQLALILAIAVFVVDGILGIVFATMAGVTPSAGGLLARILLIIPMIQGIPAIRALKQRTDATSI